MAEANNYKDAGEQPPSTVEHQAPQVAEENAPSTSSEQATEIPSANAPEPAEQKSEQKPEDKAAKPAAKASEAEDDKSDKASTPAKPTAKESKLAAEKQKNEADKPAAKESKPAAEKTEESDDKPAKPAAKKAAASPKGDKPAAKAAAKKEKPPAVEDKPFAEFMQQHYLPALEKAFAAQGIKGIDLAFKKQKYPIVGYEQDECWQVVGDWQQDSRQFNIYFPEEDISGAKFFSCNEGSRPSTLEHFLGDERRISLDLMIYGVMQRLNGQKWLSRN